MLAGIRSRLTFSNVISVIALFIALGLGTAWAIEANSVKSKHIVDGQVKQADLAPPRSWDEVGDDDGPAFSAAEQADTGCAYGPADVWRNFVPFKEPDEFQRAGFFRDNDGVVHLKGMVGRYNAAAVAELGPEFCNGEGPITTPDDIFVLPPGYRPAATSVYAVRSSGGAGEVRVRANGEVGAQSGDYSNLSLDGITFRCAPSGEDRCP